ncbi:hypothetical protein XENOCAPTIV_021182 [Xenoophorus captivus]|uniref:Uncharacterized protein n=1 Tax=Xenoophorus captivus TaxID=1517983 RepID=A0ABV0SGH5_9TELE
MQSKLKNTKISLMLRIRYKLQHHHCVQQHFLTKLTQGTPQGGTNSCRLDIQISDSKLRKRFLFFCIVALPIGHPEQKAVWPICKKIFSRVNHTINFPSFDGTNIGFANKMADISQNHVYGLQSNSFKATAR